MDGRRKRRVFTNDFKKQVVEIYRLGKSRKEIIQDYDLSPSAFDKWVKQFNLKEDIGDKENLTPEQIELKNLKNENAKLKFENEILKQAALIFGRMVK